MGLPAFSDIRPIGLDHLAELRHLHSLAYRTYLAHDLSDDQLDALIEFVQTPEYIEVLLKTECHGAWIENRLCATASWSPGGMTGASAKLIGVCVDPIFAGLGLARQLVVEAELRARRAGFAVMTARAPHSVAPFFEQLGYCCTSHGVWATPCGVNIPVVHMRKGEAKPVASATPRLPAASRAARTLAASRVH